MENKVIPASNRSLGTIRSESTRSIEFLDEARSIELLDEAIRNRVYGMIYRAREKTQQHFGQLAVCPWIASEPSDSLRLVNIIQSFHVSMNEPSDEKRIFDAIASLYLSMNPRDRQIAKRITDLHRIVLAEGEQILPASLEQFTQFFLKHKELTLPKITMTPDGTLRARWIHGPENFVAIEFIGAQRVKLVAEIPREGQQPASYFGNEAISDVVSVSRGLGGSL